MRKDLGRLLLPGAVALWLAGAGPAVAQSYPRQFDESETWVHASSGMTFPARVGPFRKFDRWQYDEAALDVSAGYGLEASGLDIVATVYVYPAPGGTGAEAACREELERRKREVVEVNPSSQLVGQGPAPPPAGLRAAGARAMFHQEASFHGRRRAVASELYVFCSDEGRWDVEYRITYPREADAAASVESFMRTLRWTLNAGSTP